MLNVFFACVGVGLLITIVREAKNPVTFIRALQEGNYGGMVFYFAATSAIIGAVFFAFYVIGKMILSLVA